MCEEKESLEIVVEENSFELWMYTTPGREKLQKIKFSGIMRFWLCKVRTS